MLDFKGHETQNVFEKHSGNSGGLRRIAAVLVRGWRRGCSSDSESLSEARRRIEKHRKADGVITVRDGQRLSKEVSWERGKQNHVTLVA